jgi:hypothetical protein
MLAKKPVRPQTAPANRAMTRNVSNRYTHRQFKQSNQPSMSGMQTNAASGLSPASNSFRKPAFLNQPSESNFQKILTKSQPFTPANYVTNDIV